MSGEFLPMTVAAGETKTFQKAGRYFEITADGGSPVNLTFFGPNGAIQSNVNNAQSGLFLEDPWNSFSVTNPNATAQALTFLLMDSGRGGSRRQPGNVTVTDTVGPGIQQQNLVDTANAQALGFSVVRTIVAPATNVRGVKLRSYGMFLTAGAGATSDCRMMAAPTAPASVSQAVAFKVGAVGSTNGVGSSDTQRMLNVTIPPGWGLYIVISNTSGAPTQCVNDVNFEVL